ncbi:hypothetical protein Leryth_012123 [Lithospermum erythrorhizon]|nr:hypothetical protein Leryth_012123 [Lithospermum erythrorhizon]
MRTINTFVTSRKVISTSLNGDQILQELEQLKNISTRVFVVHMGQLIGSRFFSKAKEAGMMSKGYAWITTDLLTSLSPIDNSAVDSKQGVVGLKPHIQKTSELKDFTTKWLKKFHQDNPDIKITEPNAFVLWAYDSSKALAMGIANAVKAPPQFKNSTNSDVLTDLDAIGTSDTGPSLIEYLRNFTFMGLSGNFRIVEGELQPPPFEIVNIVGKLENVIGYWSEKNGLSLKLEQNDGAAYSTSKDNLGLVIWPGETTDVTKGWQIPARSDQKLKIVVPAKSGFWQFVYVEEDHPTGPVNPTGFCIDVFKEVMKSMPYAVPYEFYPSDKHIYDDILKQVENEQYDAAVGDVTILEERSGFVDFTLPYAESGLSFIVPTKADDRKNAWIFTKPLALDLWLTIAAFCVLAAFVVWVLEHRVNKEFRGPPHEQAGVVFSFAFSMLVFAHKEKLMNNLTRIVVIVWIFVVLVLTSSYQASLTSILTVQKLRPTVTTISDLLKNRECIGYQDGSYVSGFLKRMGFGCTRNYSTLEEYDEALCKGTKNGGVAAIADELPYIRLFLGNYKDKYTMIESVYHTAGFGFVFQKGSPLVSDVSRAVLNVTEGKQMINITKKWIGDQTNTIKNNEPDGVTESLELESFKGLFLMAGVTFALALMIYFVIFIYENRDIISSNDRFLQKLSKLAKVLDQEKENPSVAQTPARETNEDVATRGNQQQIHPQMSEIWLSPVVSFSHHIDEDLSTPESGSPVRDAILIAH